MRGSGGRSEFSNWNKSIAMAIAIAIGFSPVGPLVYDAEAAQVKRIQTASISIAASNTVKQTTLTNAVDLNNTFLVQSNQSDDLHDS